MADDSTALNQSVSHATSTSSGSELAATSTSLPASARTTKELLRSVYDLVAEDFAAVNALIPQQLTSDVDLVEEIGRHITESGGKRLRPLLVLLVARATGVNDNAPVRLATVIEFLHTATLLHDDVVDRSALRRGRATANELWGNAPSVLVGDFLYSRAFQLMVGLESLPIMTILSDATNVIAEGEVMQLKNIGNATLSEAQYTSVIRCKTAMLFQAASHTAAELGGTPPALVAQMRDYGLNFGLAYQLVDDWLDYAGDRDTMGKNVGDDLAEGKATLPLIYTMQHGTSSDASLVASAIRSKCATDLPAVIAAVGRSGALDYTRTQALHYAELAVAQLADLPGGEHKDALEHLALTAVHRLN